MLQPCPWGDGITVLGLSPCAHISDWEFALFTAGMTESFVSWANTSKCLASLWPPLMECKIIFVSASSCVWLCHRVEIQAIWPGICCIWFVQRTIDKKHYEGQKTTCCYNNKNTKFTTTLTFQPSPWKKIMSYIDTNFHKWSTDWLSKYLSTLILGLRLASLRSVLRLFYTWWFQLFREHTWRCLYKNDFAFHQFRSKRCQTIAGIRSRQRCVLGNTLNSSVVVLSITLNSLGPIW